MNLFFRRITIVILLCAIVLFGETCVKDNRMKEYYSDRKNYITATGCVTFLNDAGNEFYIAFSDISFEFSDDCFKIVGENCEIIKQNGIHKKIAIGDFVEFVSAPRYFGDGYVMPIVALSVNGEVLLEFEDGYSNLVNSL